MLKAGSNARRRCGAKTASLNPFAAHSTKVRGGPYSAFQPGNDVREYAAELAVRSYREQRGRLGQGPVVEPIPLRGSRRCE